MENAKSYAPQILVGTEDLPREQWLEYRRKGIGGSDAAAVLGISPFRTGRDLYYDKLNIVTADDAENWVQLEVGTLLEPLVAKIFAHKTGYKIYRRPFMFRHPQYPWMLADLDYMVELPDDTTAILEIKTTNYNAKDNWWYNGEEIVPIYYESQGRHYMAVMNIDRVYFCCLYGNSEDEAIIRRIDRDMAYEEELIALERDFWENHVLTKTPPPYVEADGDLILESLRRKLGPADKDAPPVLLGQTQFGQLSMLLSLQEQKKALSADVNKLEKDIKRLKGMLIEKMGTSCTAVYNGSAESYTIGLNLSKRQSEGVEMVFRHNLSIITGGPGTGKTTVLKTVIEVYRQLYPRQKIVLGAPTGKASRRMAEATGIDEAQTLHSILGLHGDSESKKDRERKPLEAGLLIVDETSMVDMWLIHQLFSRLRPGTKVLLVGDADQLESVGAGDVFHELIGSGVVPVTVLDEIFRQAQDSLIAHNARFINEGKTTLYYGEDFAFHKAESQEETASIIRELYRKQIGAKGIEQVEILSPFRSEGEASVNSLNEAIREEINPASPETPEIVYAGKIFRLNDRVMQMRNNYEIKLYNRSGKQVGEGVFNGDIGTIRKISGTNVVIEFDGRYMDCPQVLLDDLELSYAITIHKSMGSEYDTVIIPLLAAHNVLLTRNLLYTARLLFGS